MLKFIIAASLLTVVFWLGVAYVAMHFILKAW